jgi:predicted chitinase
MSDKWQDINDPGFFFKSRKQLEQEERQRKEEQKLRDAMSDEAVPLRPVAKMSEPRWYHSDPKRAEESPDAVIFGDEIMLEIKTEGIVSGAGIDIIVQDNAASAPWMTKRKLSTRVDKRNLLQAKWKVEREKNDAEKPDYGFDAQYQGYSGSASVPTTKIKIFETITCDAVEVPDACFSADSPIPLIDDAGLFEAALVAAFKFSKGNPSKESLIFGHGGVAGIIADEYDLSKQRAEAMLCLLKNDKERFVEIAGLCGTVKDWQRCLVSLASRHGWECDPGKPDGKAGPKTGKATEAFKKHCKEKLSIAVEADQKIDDAGWGAMFEVMRKLVANAYRELAKEDALPALTFSGTSNGFYACGNAFKPEGKGIRSKDGRRAEIVFFEKGKCPDLGEHTKKTDPVTVEECPVYNNKRTARAVIEYKPAESKVLQIKTIDGPAALAHNEKGVYTVTTFNREATEAEKQAVCWVVMIDGKEVERHDKAGVRFEFTAIGKYAGEKITVHPFLRSPSDKLFIKTTIAQCLVFDGDELIWLDEAHKEVKKWRAWSGEKGKSDPAKEGGPIPAGRWVVLQSQRQQTPDDTWWQQVTNKKTLEEYGSDRIELVPFKATETHGRKRFFIHGGKEAGTGHGIDLTDKMKEFVDEFVKCGKNLVLVVDYGTALVDESSFLITSAQLEAIYGAAYKASIAKFIKPLNDTMRKYEINTPLRIAHFVAQIGHESQRFAYTEEIASGAAYEGRVKSLGNTEPGDGKRFKGRGLIQITGRSNYTAYGKYVGKEFLSSESAAKIASDPFLSCDVAGWYWKLAEKPSGKCEDLNGYAERDDVKRITELINGGLNGFDDRKQLLSKAKNVLGIK